MNISNAQSNHTLSATGTTTRPGYNGSIAISSGAKTSYSTADQAYQTYFLLAGTTTAATLTLTTGDAAGDAWTVPVQQVETATAAGTVTGTGNATVTVTAAGLTGSPLAVSVAVIDTDTATIVGGKIRTALAANTDIAAMFTISGATTDIILTRLPETIYTVGTETINMAYADDATLNVAIANDTSTGITAAPTSANTTAGVAADGAYIWNDDIDFEGIALASPTDIYALSLEHSTEETTHTMNYTIGTEYSGRTTATSANASSVLLSYPDTTTILDTLTLTGTADTGLVVATVVAKE